MSVNQPLAVSSRVCIPSDELLWRFSRSGGPGGQNVNKTSSRVELSFDVANSRALGSTLKARAIERLGGALRDGVLTIVVSEERSQRQNRMLARERLASRLARAIAPPPAPRRPTRPTRGSVERRLDAKRRQGEKKRARRVDGD